MKLLENYLLSKVFIISSGPIVTEQYNFGYKGSIPKTNNNYKFLFYKEFINIMKKNYFEMKTF